MQRFFAGIIHYTFRIRRNDMYHVVSDPRSCHDMTRKIHHDKRPPGIVTVLIGCQCNKQMATIVHFMETARTTMSEKL